MSQAKGDIATILSEAEALLSRARGDLDEAAGFYRSNGLDQARVASLARVLGPKEKAEAERLIKADQEAIEQKVAEAAARARFAAAPSGRLKKLRKLV